MRCLLDNIIFSLQKGGGVSVVWQQHVSRLLHDSEVLCELIEYDNAGENLFRRELDIPSASLRQRSSGFLFLKRYLDVNEKMEQPFLFHSSYYRLCTVREAINVTTVHDFTYEYFFGKLRQQVHSRQKYKAIRGAEGVICISESTKRDLLRFLPDVKESKIRVIYNGVDDRFRLISGEEKNSVLPFPDQGFILYVGDRKNGYKNFDLVVKTCKKMQLPLVMVGGGGLTRKEDIYLNQVLRKGYYHHVNNASVEVLNEIYNRAFALIYPSLYEGFGIPVIEAQRAGCPVIAYAHSSIPEIIGKSEYALQQISEDTLCEALAFLKNQSGEREKVVREGLENAQRFSWDRTYKETLEFYRDLYH